MTIHSCRCIGTASGGSTCDEYHTNWHCKKCKSKGICTFVDGAEAAITEFSALVEGVGGLLELLVGEEVRRCRVVDAAGLHVADPGTRGPARAAVLEELRG